MRKKLSSKVCAKACPWGRRPWALLAAGQWALPTPTGPSASCREVLGAGKWKPSDGLATCISLSFYKTLQTCILLPLTFYLAEQSKYLRSISVHLIFGSLPWRGACVRTGWAIRSNVSVEVKAAAGERKVALFFFFFFSETSPSKITFSDLL